MSMRMVSYTATTDGTGVVKYKDDGAIINTGVVASLAAPELNSPTVVAVQTGDHTVLFRCSSNSGPLQNKQVTINFILY